ncbi:MAG TPA: hypothetical protein VIU94_33910, partial [Streptomyces sp.]
MSTLDNIVAIMRGHASDLRAESADHAREATAITDRMAEPADVYRAMEAEERDLVAKLEALRGAMKTSASALAAMKNERDRHRERAALAADAAATIEGKVIAEFTHLAADVPPVEALAATGLMPPKEDARTARCGDVCAEHAHPCDRDPGHLGPHRDRQQKGTESCSWESFEVEPPDPDAPAAVPVVAPTPPRDPDQPGTVVAVSGPTVTQPDPGAAHPVPNPASPLPPAEPGPHRHAKPGF